METGSIPIPASSLRIVLIPLVGLRLAHSVSSHVCDDPYSAMLEAKPLVASSALSSLASRTLPCAQPQSFLQVVSG